jgi:hypothetical protein
MMVHALHISSKKLCPCYQVDVMANRRGEVVVEKRHEIDVVNKTIVLLYSYTNSVVVWLNMEKCCQVHKTTCAWNLLYIYYSKYSN